MTAGFDFAKLCTALVAASAIEEDGDADPVFKKLMGKCHDVNAVRIAVVHGRWNSTFGGTGGQGLILSAKMLADAMAADGRSVAQSQSYEPRSRRRCVPATSAGARRRRNESFGRGRADLPQFPGLSLPPGRRGSQGRAALRVGRAWRQDRGAGMDPQQARSYLWPVSPLKSDGERAPG